MSGGATYMVPEDDWRPFDTAPRDGKEILVNLDGNAPTIAAFMRPSEMHGATEAWLEETMDDDHPRWYEHYGAAMDDGDATHWMPLPAPPPPRNAPSEPA